MHALLETLLSLYFRHQEQTTFNRLQLELELYRAIAAQALGGFIHAIGGMEDHAHVAVSIPLKLAAAKFSGDVKGNRSHYINHVIKPGFESAGR